jgi:hypothetical protein
MASAKNVFVSKAAAIKELARLGGLSPTQQMPGGS